MFVLLVEDRSLLPIEVSLALEGLSDVRPLLAQTLPATASNSPTAQKGHQAGLPASAYEFRESIHLPRGGAKVCTILLTILPGLVANSFSLFPPFANSLSLTNLRRFTFSHLFCLIRRHQSLTKILAVRRDWLQLDCAVSYGPVGYLSTCRRIFQVSRTRVYTRIR